MGQQVSATPASFNDATVVSRIQLMLDRADAGDCELVVKGVIAGEARGCALRGRRHVPARPRRRRPDRQDRAAQSRGRRRPGAHLHLRSAGSGTRIGIDRDEDGFFDRDELDAGFDPADPSDPTVCDDGLDNDVDGFADASDPGCRDANATTENPGCNDGIDNDLDGLADMADSDCGNPWSDNEIAAGASCGLLGVEALPVLAWAATRRRRRPALTARRVIPSVGAGWIAAGRRGGSDAQSRDRRGRAQPRSASATARSPACTRPSCSPPRRSPS